MTALHSRTPCLMPYLQFDHFNQVALAVEKGLESQWELEDACVVSALIGNTKPLEEYELQTRMGKCTFFISDRISCLRALALTHAKYLSPETSKFRLVSFYRSPAFLRLLDQEHFYQDWYCRNCYRRMTPSDGICVCLMSAVIVMAPYLKVMMFESNPDVYVGRALLSLYLRSMAVMRIEVDVSLLTLLFTRALRPLEIEVEEPEDLYELHVVSVHWEETIIMWEYFRFKIGTEWFPEAVHQLAIKWERERFEDSDDVPDLVEDDVLGTNDQNVVNGLGQVRYQNLVIGAIAGLVIFPILSGVFGNWLSFAFLNLFYVLFF